MWRLSNSLNCDLNVNGILDATNLDFTILFYILHFEQFLGQTFVSSFIRKKWWIIFTKESNYEGVNKKSVVKQVSWLNIWSSQSFTSYFYFLPLIVGALYAINALSSVLIEYVWEQSSSVASYSLINIHTYLQIYPNQQKIHFLLILNTLLFFK